MLEVSYVKVKRMECPYCAAKNRDRAKYCRLCAQRIDGEGLRHAESPGADEIEQKTADEGEHVALFAAPRNVAVAAGLLLIVAFSGFLFFSEERSDSIVKAELPAIPVVAASALVSQQPPRPDRSGMLGVSHSATPESPAPSSEAVPSSESQGAGSGSAAANLKISQAKKEIGQAFKKQQAAQKAAQKSKTEPYTPVGQAQRGTLVVKRGSWEEAPARPANTALAASQPVIKTAMATDLEACEDKSFFAKGLCQDRIRWKYCQDKWGESAECPKPSIPNEGGG